MAGLEVEEMTAVAPAFDNVVVAQVLTMAKHPDADRLNVLSVDVGQGGPLNIVCGAQNVAVGMKAPCALVGAKLPGMEIKQAKVRGVDVFRHDVFGQRTRSGGRKQRPDGVGCRMRRWDRACANISIWTII